MEKEIWDYLYSKIGNKYGVSALMGNLYAESGLNPINMENHYEKKLGYNDKTYTQAVDNGTYKNFGKDSVGYGLAQWTWHTRKKKLLAFAQEKKTSIGDLYMQLDFLINELQNSYKSVYNSLRKTTNIKDASNQVLFKFERPADQSEKVQNKRASYGQKYFDKYANKEITQENPKDEIKQELKFKIGDEVVLNGYLYKTSNSTKPSSTIKNKKTQITKISAKSKHQYNTTGNLGWMDESSIKLNVIEYYPKISYKGGSIVDGLKSIKVDSSFNNRKKIAKANGIGIYLSLGSQNIKLLKLLKDGKLIKP